MSNSANKTVAQRPHRLEKEIEIAAPIGELWSALTDSRKLADWFPLEARVTPGKHGKIFVSWGPDCEGEAQILEWEPGKRLAWQEPRALVEFTLESRGGKTLVRLVQSGFLTGADWEKECYESTNYGWDFILLSLRLLLERHRGQERKVAWPRQPVTMTRQEAYRKLLRPDGLFQEDAAASLQEGQPFVLTTVGGEKLSGHTELVKESRGICLRVTEWDDALFWVSLEGGDGKVSAQIWISTFGTPQTRVDELNSIWSGRLKNIFQ